MSNGIPKPETPEVATRRMTAEEEELSQLPSYDSEPGNKLAYDALLAAKHNDEIETRQPFANPLDHQRYDAHKLEEGENFQADPNAVFARGEIITTEGDVFMGINQDGSAVLRRVDKDGDENDFIEHVEDLSELHAHQNNLDIATFIEHSPASQEPVPAITEVAQLKRVEDVVAHEAQEKPSSLADLKKELQLRIDDEVYVRNLLRQKGVTRSRRENAEAYLVSNKVRFHSIAKQLGLETYDPDILLGHVEQGLEKVSGAVPSGREDDKAKQVEELSREEKQLLRITRALDAGNGMKIPDDHLRRHQDEPKVREYVLNDILAKIKAGDTNALDDIHGWRWSLVSSDPTVAAYQREELLSSREHEKPVKTPAFVQLKQAEYPYIEGLDGDANEEMVSTLKRDLLNAGMSNTEIESLISTKIRKSRKNLSPYDITSLRTRLLGRIWSNEIPQLERASFIAAALEEPIEVSVDEANEDFKKNPPPQISSEELVEATPLPTPPIAPKQETIEKSPKLVLPIPLKKRMEALTPNEIFSQRMRELDSEATALSIKSVVGPTEKLRLIELQNEMIALESAYLRQRAVNGGAGTPPTPIEATPTVEAIPVQESEADEIPEAEAEALEEFALIPKEDAGQEMYVDAMLEYMDSLDTNEVAPIAPKVPLPINEAITSKFQTEFAISSETLHNIEGFRMLSEGQQRLVLERMKTIAFQDINKEKIVRFRKKIEQSEADAKAVWESNKNINYKYMYRFGAALRRMGLRATKQYQLGKLHDEIASQWHEGNDVDVNAMKQETLTVLTKAVQRTEDFGMNEAGNKTSFVELSDFRNVDAELIQKVDEFNTVANNFANTEFGDTKEDIDAKADLKLRYDILAKDMTKLLVEKGTAKWSGERAAIWRTKLETAVTMSRFFGDNKEAGEEYEKSGRNIGAAIGMKNLLVERGIYTAASAGARFLGVSAIGLAALPAVAAGGGWYYARKRGKQEFSENDLLLTMGEEESVNKSQKTGVKNVVNGQTLLSKLEALMKEYEDASEAKSMRVALRNPNGMLVKDGEGNPIKYKEEVTEKEARKRALEARIAYTMRKLEDKAVDLGGSPTERVLAMSELALAVGKAQAQLGFTEARVNALRGRLSGVLAMREETLASEREVDLLKKGVSGATMGAAFSLSAIAIGSIIPAHRGGDGIFGSEYAEAHGEGHYSADDIAKVKASLLARTDPSLPRSLMEGSNQADAKAYAEYMAEKDPAVRHQIAEVIGQSEKAMDDRISAILSGKVKIAPPVADHASAPIADEEAAHASESAVNSMSPKEEIIEVMPFAKADALAKSYVSEDMTSHVLGMSGKPKEEWLLLRGRMASDVLPQLRENSALLPGGADEWSSVARMQEYAKANGFTKEAGFTPKQGESLEQFFVRAHAEKLVTQGIIPRIPIPAEVIPPRPLPVATPRVVPQEVGVPTATTEQVPSKPITVETERTVPPVQTSPRVVPPPPERVVPQAGTGAIEMGSTRYNPPPFRPHGMP